MAQISEERRKRLEQEEAKNAGGGNFVSFKTRDKAVLRLIPVPENEDVGTKRGQYFINGKGYTCPAATFGKPGVIDRAKKALTALAGDDEAQAIAGSLDQNFKITFMMKVVDRADPDKAQWYGAPGKSVYRPLMAMFREQGLEMDNVKEGHDFIVTKKGAGKGTQWAIQPVIAASPLAPTKEERQAIRAAAAEMNVAEIISTDEKGALEALVALIPKNIWKQIKGKVLEGLNLGEDDGDAGEDDGEGDEDAPPKKKKPAADGDDDEPAPVKKKAAVVEADDDEAPPPKKKVVAADDDDEAPPPKKKAAAVEADDDEAPPPKKKVAAADDDDEAPPPKKKAPVEADDDEAPPPKKKVVAADDDDEAPPPKKKVVAADDDDEAPPPKKKAAVVEDDDEAPPPPKKKRIAIDE